jgi:tetratricopeptide (TPR) repeat protein
LAESRDHADKALKISPESIEANLMRGVVALFEKDYASAEKYCQAVLGKLPDNFAANNNSALALCEQDDATKKKRAVDVAEANMRRYPEDMEAMATYGRALYRSGDIKKAEEVLRPVLDQWEINCDHLYYLACVANELGRESESLLLLNKALNPNTEISINQFVFSMKPEASKLYSNIQEKKNYTTPKK